MKVESLDKTLCKDLPRFYTLCNAQSRDTYSTNNKSLSGETKPTTTELLITNKCAKRVADNFPAYTGMQAQLNQMGMYLTAVY